MEGVSTVNSIAKMAKKWSSKLNSLELHSQGILRLKIRPGKKIGPTVINKAREHATYIVHPHVETGGSVIVPPICRSIDRKLKKIWL